MATCFFIGTSGFHYDGWQGLFYPEDLPKARWLKFYAHHFSTVELNSPFYRLPTEVAFRGWKDRTPEGFVFAVKVSRFITHIKRLHDCQEALENFLSRARLLGEKLGPLLYQLPPGMKLDIGLLEKFLSTLPQSLHHVFEFRSDSWFTDETLALLRRYNVALCVHDMRSMHCPVAATADFAYVRFHGPTGTYAGCYADDQLREWAAKIQEMSRGLSSCYIYFNNDIGGHAVENARTLRSLLASEE